MQSTKNYQLVKQELTDEADITQISGNWDKIDTELKKLDDEKFDKAGGKITGATTVNGKITAKGGESIAGGLTVTGGTTTDTLKVTGAITAGSVTTTEGVSAGSMTVTGDATVNGKVLADAIRAKIGSQSMNIGVNKPDAVEELLGMIIQWVSGTTPRISLTHNPDKASNDKSVATTNWVKSLIATNTEYGLVRVADETDVITPDVDDAAITPAVYHDVSDFRHKSTVYKVGDKVECMFNHELWLECTKAGTTSETPLDTRNVKHGQVLTDGTVQWTVRTHIVTVNNVKPDANGNISIRTGVTSVDGVLSDSNGNVALNAMAYKKLSSIQSVKGSFWFDNLSGIDTTEIPEKVINADWVGVQYGMASGADKTQVIRQGYEWFWRYSDQHLGQETWSDWERFDPRYTSQNYLKLDGSNTMTDTIVSSVKGMFIDAANGKTIINSTSTNGDFNPLWQYESTNEGSFVVSGHKTALRIDFFSKENKESLTNTPEWTMSLNEDGNLNIPKNLTLGEYLRFSKSGDRIAAYVTPAVAEVGGQFDFILAGANQATFICSGETGYDTEEMKVFREALKRSIEDIVLVSDNNVVIAANCNANDLSTVKKAVLQTNGLFMLPVHPAASSNDTTAATTKWVNDIIKSKSLQSKICPLDQDVTFENGGNNVTVKIFLNGQRSIDVDSSPDVYNIVINGVVKDSVEIRNDVWRYGGAGFGRGMTFSLTNFINLKITIKVGDKIKLTRNSNNIGFNHEVCYAEVTVSN